MTDPLREAMIDVWECVYQMQVIVSAMDPSLLEKIGAHIINLQYRIAIAKLRAEPCGPRGHAALLDTA